MQRKRGFTLVELNLAILFVAILVLGVAFATIHITRIYQKGLTVRTINQVGREVNAQLRRDISEAQPMTIQLQKSPDDHWGRVCLGGVSYVYNTAAGIAAGDTISADDRPDGIFLVRTEDPDRLWCERDEADTGAFTKAKFEAGESFTELLTNDVTELAIHQLNITEYVLSSGDDDGVPQHLYQLAMQLGTNEAGTTTDDGRCKPPTTSEANFEYCFIAEFETTIRAGGGEE